MTRLEKRPESMPPPGSGPLLVLGYMKQFRAHFMADVPTGRLLLLGRQVRDGRVLVSAVAAVWCWRHAVVEARSCPAEWRAGCVVST